MLRHGFALFVTLGLLPGATARADNWPQFRGPTGQGLVLEGKLPTDWSETKNVAWKQPIPGSGWSSPIVWAKRIFLTTSVPVAESPSKDQSLRALCLDARTGEIVWDREVLRLDGAKAPRIHSKNSHASPTSITDGERLHVHFGHQGTACLDLDGQVLWRNTELRYAPVHGSGGSPILVDDLLVFSVDGSDQQFVVALDARTGKVRWKTDRQSEAIKQFSFSTPLLITVKGQRQIVSQASDAVVAYEPRTGKEVWRVRYKGYSLVPRPVYGHGLLFVCTGFDSPTLIAIRPEGEGDLTQDHIAWTERRAVPLNPSPVLVGAELYMVSDQGVASCLDAQSGKVHWRERIGSRYSASPVAAGGKVYFQDEDGVTVVVNASKEFQRVAKNALGERTLASYAVAEGAIFLRTEKHLYRIEER